MGKRKKRMTMSKYASKYATKREALAKKRGVIEIDLTTGEEITEEEAVQVIANEESKEETTEKTPVLTPEPQLQTIQIEEAETTKARTPKKPSTRRTAKTKKTTTRKKRTTKKTASAD